MNEFQRWYADWKKPAQKVTYYVIPFIWCSGKDRTKKKENGSGISSGYSGEPQRGRTRSFFPQSDGACFISVTMYMLRFVEPYPKGRFYYKLKMFYKYLECILL